jgi:hypothetical protein
MHSSPSDLLALRVGLDARVAVRYVQHIQHLEEAALTHSKRHADRVHELSRYEDHLVVFDAATASCTDMVVARESVPVRLVDYAEIYERHVPKTWRDAVRIEATPAGFQLK